MKRETLKKKKTATHIHIDQISTELFGVRCLCPKQKPSVTTKTHLYSTSTLPLSTWDTISHYWFASIVNTAET